MEVENAMKEIASNSIPSFDRFIAKFFQCLWSLVGNDVIVMVLLFLNKGFLLMAFNETMIALILKRETQAPFIDYRHISLHFVGYKFITKLLVLILQLVLQDLITPF